VHEIAVERARRARETERRARETERRARETERRARETERRARETKRRARETAMRARRRMADTHAHILHRPPLRAKWHENEELHGPTGKIDVIFTTS